MWRSMGQFFEFFTTDEGAGRERARDVIASCTIAVAFVDDDASELCDNAMFLNVLRARRLGLTTMGVDEGAQARKERREVRRDSRHVLGVCRF